MTWPTKVHVTLLAEPPTSVDSPPVSLLFLTPSFKSLACMPVCLCYQKPYVDIHSVEYSRSLSCTLVTCRLFISTALHSPKPGIGKPLCCSPPPPSCSSSGFSRSRRRVGHVSFPPCCTCNRLPALFYHFIIGSRGDIHHLSLSTYAHLSVFAPDPLT